MEGWRTWAGDSSGSEQVITDSTRAHSGSEYLQLSTTTAQVWTANETVPVNPGDQLTFGGWVYLEPGSATGGAIGWNLSVLDANGNALGFPGAINVTSGAWTYQSVNYTVPAGGASVTLYAQLYQPTGLTTARFDDAFLTGASGLGVRYYHADHLGSARLMTDSGGNQTWSATYLPFGQEWNPQPTTNHYKFTGKERDSESGNDNFGARYYSSSMGRFTSPDPLGGHTEDPQTMNRYAYVRNNPLTLTDPTGLDFFLQCTDKDHNGCVQVQIDPKNDHQTWVQADKNGAAVVISSDSIREGQNTATVDQNGVVINGKDQGIYFKNAASDEERSGDGTDHNPITLAGRKGGALEGFGITINGNCGGSCLSSGTWSYSGSLDDARGVLYMRGSFSFPFEDARAALGRGDHPYSTQHRFGAPTCPIFACENSPHISVPLDPKYNVPQGFHVDAHGDWYHHNQDVDRKGVE